MPRVVIFNTMSRIGKQPIPIPEKTQVDIKGNIVVAKGELGELTVTIPEEFKVETQDNAVTIAIAKKHPKSSAFWGLYRSLINNIIIGVSHGFEKVLEIHGIGYRAAVQGKELVLNLGYSHPITVTVPDTITVAVEKNNVITIKGLDKQQVGQLAANIRAYRKPEPYKGKGVRYRGEYVRRKVGKRVVAG